MKSTTTTWLCDLDGVLWRADQPIAGSPEAITRLGALGVRVAYFTNNSFVTRADLLARFARLGYLVDSSLVFSSAQVAASLCQPGTSAFVVGGGGIKEALHARGVQLVDLADLARTSVDAVVVGLDPGFTYPLLAGALRALEHGARLIGTNEDATFPTPGGIVPGAGALLAAVAFASGATPTVAGKPHQPTVDLLRERLGEIDLVVGDRPSSDGALAARLGTRFALVRSGVTPAGSKDIDPVPDLDEADLGAVVARYFADVPS